MFYIISDGLILMPFRTNKRCFGNLRIKVKGIFTAVILRDLQGLVSMYLLIESMKLDFEGA